MIKKGLKDFLKCLKYYLVPFGILSIFTLFGLQMGVLGINRAISNFFSKAAEMASHATIDWAGIKTAVMERIFVLNFMNDPIAALKTAISASWIKETLTTVAKTAFGDSLTIEMINDLLNETLGALTMSLMSFVMMVLVGLIVGFVLMKVLLRKELTKVKIGKLILYSLADALLWSVVIALLILLNRFVPWLFVILLVLVITSLPFICICEGYLFYGIKKIPFTKVANFKNVLKILLIELIIATGTVAITMLTVLIFKIFVGVYLVLPIIEIGIISIGLTAENNVVNTLQEYQPPVEEPQVAEEK